MQGRAQGGGPVATATAPLPSSAEVHPSRSSKRSVTAPLKIHWFRESAPQHHSQYLCAAFWRVDTIVPEGQIINRTANITIHNTVSG